jgi:hypothetical protein
MQLAALPAFLEGVKADPNENGESYEDDDPHRHAERWNAEDFPPWQYPTPHIRLTLRMLTVMRTIPIALKLLVLLKVMAARFM